MGATEHALTGRRRAVGRLTCLLLALGGAQASGAQGQTVPATGAERAGWARATNHQEVLELLDLLGAASSRVEVRTLGRTVEGRDHPVVFLGEPPRQDAAGTVDPDRPTILVLGSIHGDEPAGKDGALQFIRALALGADSILLSSVNVVVVPHMNPDGGEAGRRQNALGYDLNRDWIVAESPEVRGVLDQLVTRLWPEVFIDAHNGGSLPYHLTYQATLDPAADAELVAYARGPMYDAVRSHFDRLEMHAYWYSGPAFDSETGEWYWRTTEPLPRKQHSYGGLQDMIALLLEVPSQHPRDIGAKAVREGLLALTRHVAEHASAVQAIVSAARLRTLSGALGEIPLEVEAVAHADPESFFVVPSRAGRGGGDPEWVTGENRTLHVATRSRPAPWGYALDPGLGEVAELLRMHGIEWIRLAESVVAEVERFRLDGIRWASELYQNHALAEVEVALVRDRVTLPPGTYVVPTGQRGGRLIPQLLEPDAVDSVVRWNFLDEFIEREGGVGTMLPIARLERPIPSGVF